MSTATSSIPVSGRVSWVSRIPLRELGMIPAIILALIIGAIVSPVFLS